MARLGIDFGTTNTVAVVADRGHHAVVLHGVETRAGRVVEEVFPSSIWISGLLPLRSAPAVPLEGALPALPAGEEWRFGLEAERRLRRGADGGPGVQLGSLKRMLRGFIEGQTLDLGGGRRVAVEEALVRFLSALRASIVRSGLVREDEPLECVVSWPANSNGAQRHITRRAFRAAGFAVLGSVNEPAASAIEYADRIARGNREAARRLASAVLVFDLGGGTFDTSLVRIDGGDFHVVDSAGIERLGGDDFDETLLAMLLEPLGIRPEALPPASRQALLRHARLQKESIARDPERERLELVPADHGLPGGRRPDRPVRVRVADYYDRLRPRLEEAADVVEWLLTGPRAAGQGLGPGQVDSIYLVGGASRLPLVGMVLGERFPRLRIVSSDKPFTSVAMGAAIVAAERARVSDIIGRHFGVMRLRDWGRREFFDPIFSSGTRLPGRGDPPLEYEVRYSPVHNIGRLRYLECSRLGADGLPEGEARPWSEVLFPYDPAIPPERPVTPAEVAAAEHLRGTSVVERYYCDSDGVITVKLERRADGVERVFELSPT